MAPAGAHLVDNLLLDAPLRQWVWTAAFPLRMLLAKDADLLRSAAVSQNIWEFGVRISGRALARDRRPKMRARRL
jgi:hypothetical protein